MGATPATGTFTVTSFGEVRPAGWHLIVSIGSGSSRVVALGERADLVIGRHPSCAVMIEHEGVSRRHARVVRRDEHITVEDLGSHNGTLVNGSPITGARRLAAGDVIAVGPATAMLAIASAARTSRHVATIDELEDRLEAEVDRASRYHRPLALAMVRVEGAPELADAFVDGVLAGLRRIDLIAEYGPNEFVLVLPETDAGGARTVVERGGVATPGVKVSAGFATFPESGSHAAALIGGARDDLAGTRPRLAPRPAPVGEDVVAIDPQMKYVFELAARAAASPITVLITGETGVGKEVVAEAIHRLGVRRGPLIKLNCAALPEQLVESELFGHEKGAFTGAVAAKAGYFEAAGGGTLFLDEIGELPPAAQVKLLRAVEQRRIVRVGGTREMAVDVRLVCATNRDLEVEVARGRFRQDLMFRIGAFVIPVPPLRDRRIEIAVLAMRFVRELADRRVPAIAPEAREALEGYDWPGNVRELRNIVERALVLSGGERIELAHLPDRLHGAAQPAVDVRQRVADVERDAVVAALQATGGNQTQAARVLGVTRFALIRLMQKHQLRRPR
jgi:two-component system, NtrC family, response regulator AtoC